MVGVVVATHGRLGQELVATAEGIVGPMLSTACVTIDPAEGPETIRGKIGDAIGEVDHGEGVLILTDMFGGTPANVSLTWLEDNKVEVLTGVNLPMLLKLATSREAGADLHQTALALTAYGQKNVCCASELLRGKTPAPLKGAP